ncbi:MAG: hypothetical protein ACF8QF_02035 [Phycisphaerales bacterium]
MKESAACDQRIVPDASRAGDTWADRTEQLPERLAYARYLERQNTEQAAPAPTRDDAATRPNGGDARETVGDTRPGRQRTEVERRIETTYQVRIISPAGRYLDMWV